METEPEIRALIFDMDGVIVDTIEWHYLSWKRLVDEEGVRFDRADNDQLRGVARRQCLEMIVEGQRELTELEIQSWLERKHTYFYEYMQQITPEYRLPGVTQLIDAARAAGMKVGVASASQNAHPILKQLDLLDTLDALGDPSCVVNIKPAPDLFLWTAGRLGVNPREAIVIEDAEAGVEAALSGGFWTVGLGSANVEKAHLRLPDLANVTLADLVEHFSGQMTATLGR